MKSVKITEVRNYSDFLALEDFWKDLLKYSSHTIFSTWEWISTWWKYFGKENNLKILLAMDKEQLVGIAPLMVSQHQFLFNFNKIREIEFIGRGNADYNTFIFKSGMNKIPNFFINHLLGVSDWDIITLLDMSEEGSSADFLQSINNKFPNFKLNISNFCPYIDLPSSLPSYTMSLSRNLRKNLKKRMKRLESQYKVEFKTQHDFASVRDAMEIYFNLHDKRWQSKKGQSISLSKINRDFHLELAKTFDEKKWLALYFLTVDDEPIAAVYSFDYDLKKYGYNTGFDPEFSKYGIGSLLKTYAIKESIKKGFREYDLLRGNEPYKTNWATGVRKNYVAKMAKKSWRGSLLLQINKVKQNFRSNG